jgi:FKBP-type peptidyl-prolyl cis-trans isomerase
MECYDPHAPASAGLTPVVHPFRYTPRRNIMKRSSALLGACLLLLTTASCSESADSAPTDNGAAASDASLGKPVESQGQVAYTMGLNLGRNMAAQGIEIDLAYLFRGIEDAMNEADPLMTEEEMMAAMQSFQQEMEAKATAMMAEAAVKNAEEGAAFLATYLERPEVQALPSGVQYEVIQAGEGPKPSATSQVTVHYRGTMIDGAEFDNSYDRGQPATFPLNGVIPGWSAGLQEMNVGSIWKLFIPGEMAYGMNPPPQGPIGPNATLIFVVELLAIEEG